MLDLTTRTGLRMGLNAIAFFIVCSVICESLGDIQLSCNTVDPMLPSKIKCTCRYTNGEGIQWYKNNVYMADCYLKTKICLLYSGHSFSLNSFGIYYIIEKGGYNYSSCDVYTCRDLYQPEINASKRIAVHDSTSISALNVMEPTTNHSSGFIGVTTECIYGASSEVTDLYIQWLVVTGSVEKSFNPVKTTIKSLNGSCQLCDGDKATQFHIGFEHKDNMECQAKEAKFRIILRHKGISSEPLNITTRNVYCVSDQTVDGSTSRRSIIRFIVIVFVIFGCLLLQYIVLGFIHIRRKRNTKFNHPPGDESCCFLIRRNPGMKGNHDTNIEMKGFIVTYKKEGKMKSDSTKLIQLQDWFLLLAHVPVLGIIGIIAYLYTCCSGTGTEGKSAKGDVIMTVTPLENFVNTRAVQMKLRQPHKGDQTEHKGSDEGYKRTSSTSSSEESQ